MGEVTTIGIHHSARRPATWLLAAEADPARGRQVVRAEPMSTLDAELNDFGAQPAMLRGHAADRDG